jgi:hypothetical protein
LFVLSFVKGCVHLSFETFSKMICYKEIDTSILEYTSTANISTTPPSP